MNALRVAGSAWLRDAGNALLDLDLIRLLLRSLACLFGLSIGALARARSIVIMAAKPGEVEIEERVSAMDFEARYIQNRAIKNDAVREFLAVPQDDVVVGTDAREFRTDAPTVPAQERAKKDLKKHVIDAMHTFTADYVFYEFKYRKTLGGGTAVAHPKVPAIKRQIFDIDLEKMIGANERIPPVQLNTSLLQVDSEDVLKEEAANRVRSCHHHASASA